MDFVDLIAKKLAEHLADTKENMDSNFFMSLRPGNNMVMIICMTYEIYCYIGHTVLINVFLILQDPMKLFSDILSSCLRDKFQNKFPEVSKFKSIKSSTVALCIEKISK